PTLRPVPRIDLDACKHTQIERIDNPTMSDTLARQCADSSDGIPKWMVPVSHENLEAGRPVGLSAAIVASWARYAEGVDDNGAAIDVVDNRKGPVMAAAQRQNGADPLAFLRDRDLFGNRADRREFTEPYLAALDAFHSRGARATIG